MLILVLKQKLDLHCYLEAARWALRHTILGLL